MLNKIQKAGIAVSSCVSAAFLSVVPAQAASFFDLSYSGFFGNSLSGTAELSDLNNDGFIRSSSAGEIASFDVEFFDPLGNSIISYDLLALESFAPTGLNFNFEVATQEVLQSGNPADLDGFSIGDPLGALLASSTGGIFFNDSVTGVNFDFGGTLFATESTVVPGPTPTAIPEPATILGSLLAVGGGSFLRRKRHKAQKAS